MRAHDTPSTDQELTFTVTVGHGGSSGATTLTNVYGRNWVQSISIRQSIDQAVSEMEMVLSREEYELSLAPLQGNSLFNSSAVALELGHFVIVSCTDSSGSHEIFRGKIDEIDWASPQIIVRARDIAADLQDRFSELAKWYALGRIPYGVRAWTPGGTAATGEYIAPEVQVDSGATPIYYVTSGGTFADLSGEAGNEVWPSDYDSFLNGSVTMQRVQIGSEYWAAETAYALGDIRMPTDDGDERGLCVQAGTSGESEPTWGAVGATVTDGTVKWAMLPLDDDGFLALEAVLNALISDNYGTSAPGIYFSAATGYMKNPTLVQPASILETMRTFASEIGWDLRLKEFTGTVTNHEVTPGSDNGWAYWRLQLYEPDRTKTTADATFTSADVYSASRCAQSLTNIRNAIEVAYVDADAAGFDGVTNIRKYVRTSDATSINKYGRRFFGISCASANSISTTTEATALAAAILSDLKDPELEWTVTTPFRWWLEINDLLAFTTTTSPQAGGFPHFNSTQKLAVVGLSHNIRMNGNRFEARTQISTRGKPTAGIKVWIAKEGGPGRGHLGWGADPFAPGEATVVSSVKGGSVDFTPPKFAKPKAGYGSQTSGEHEEAMLFLSPSTGFTPSSTTYKASTRTTRFDLTGLTTGSAQYGRICYKDKLGRFSAFSPEFALTPSQAALGDLDDGLKVACLVSGGFQYVTADPTHTPYGKLTMTTESFDDGGAFDLPNSWFVVPADGVYRFVADTIIENMTTVPDPPVFDDRMRMVGTDRYDFALVINGTKIGGLGSARVAPGETEHLHCFVPIALSEDDVVELYCSTGNNGKATSTRVNGFRFNVERVWSR